MTKKRTTLYLESNHISLLNEMTEDLNLNQSEVIRKAIENYYLSLEYKEEKERNELLNKR